jgi:transcriptional regulator with XRE-family HTH domain
MDLPRILGRNVRELRKRASMSQEELALETGMKRGYISDLERGTVTFPSRLWLGSRKR